MRPIHRRPSTGAPSPRWSTSLNRRPSEISPKRSPAFAPDAAPAYELAYEEARRALDGQERALAAFRTRAGIVLSAAAIVTSFLGGQAIGANGFTTVAWVAITAFAVVGVATLCVLWPDDNWQFEAIPNQVIGTYIERNDALDVPLHAIHRDLALHRMETSMAAPKPSSPAPSPKPQPIFPSPMNPGTRGTGPASGN